MAVIAYTHDKIGPNVHRIIWPNMADEDTGAIWIGYSDAIRNVQATAADFDGATVTIEGTLQATPIVSSDFQVMHDTAGVDLTFAAGTPRIEQIQEGAIALRPNAGSAGSASVDITIILVETQRGRN